MLKIVVVLCLFLALASAKIYGRCEFAREIQTYGVPSDQVAVWTCIAQHESDYNTAAVNWSSGDHGIYQINEHYWCSTSGTPGGDCNAVCSQFEDDDIADDTACAQLIYGKMGFKAWTTYKFCNGDVSEYIAGCWFFNFSLFISVKYIPVRTFFVPLYQ